MSWEKRQRGGRYYTRTRRVRGMRVREYVGTGPIAELIALFDEEDRCAREAKRAVERHRMAEGQGAEGVVQELWAAASRYMTSELEAAGFRRHHRGEWRRRHASCAEE